ncbi:hypothetical protein CSM81_20990 [Salmonella enterica subsp. enterica serovar Infantis]|nr:hypothetical protein [Salmonella enterica subsp. enterica serovar Infantis]
MRYLILITALMGGLLSFNSFANDVSLPPVTVGTIYHDATLDSNGYFHTTWYNIPYICFDCHFNSDGKTASGTWYLNDGSYDVPFPDKKPDTKPSDKPDTDKPTGDTDNPGPTPPVTPPDKPSEPDKPVGPELPDYSKPAYPQDMVYVNNQLAYINSHTPDQLYKNYHLVYDSTRTWADNRAVYKALVNKLHDVYPPTYKTAEMFNASVKAWQNAYWQSVPELQGIPENCKGGFLLPDECVVYKPLMDSYSKYVSPGVSTVTGAIGNINGVNDPDYYSYSDYKNGITRCDINPMDSSCNKPDDSGSGDGHNPDGNHNNHDDGNTNTDNPGTGGGTGSDGGDKPATCPPGSHHVPGSLPGSCTADLNPGGGGGSGSGNTDNNDNGDVVAAINAFHADNNKNHKELMDDLNKKPADPDYTGMEGEFSSMVGGAMSGITDSFKSAWDAGKAAFGEGLSGIDSMLPDIKTSFDLPPGFEAASTGRCIPVVLDFDIKLVGIPDYHFHAVGTQVCLLYDQYIRPVLNFCMVILSFFVIHRLLVRSAEFLTDGRH